MATQTVIVRVEAVNIWQQTKVVVQSGDQLSVSVPNPGLPNPNHPKPWPWGPNCDPDGNRTDGIAPTTWANAIAPNIVQFSLIGRIGENGTPFLIGSSFNQPAPASGCLYLSFNDGVNFNDNSGYWDVSVTYEECAQISSAYGTDRVFLRRVNTSLLSQWGVILTVQCGTTATNAVWNNSAINNVVAAFQTVNGRITSQTTLTFKDVFGGLEFRFVDTLGAIGGRTLNENVIRFGDVGRAGAQRTNSSQQWGITGAPGYPSVYGLRRAANIGIRNTIIHELGHVFYERSASMLSTAGAFVLPRVHGPNPQGTYWENNFDPVIGEYLPDHFLNWVRNTYTSANPDQYNPSDSDNDRRISAFWVGGVEFVESGISRGTSPGIQSFANEASSVAQTSLAILEDFTACIVPL